MAVRNWFTGNKVNILFMGQCVLEFIKLDEDIGELVPFFTSSDPNISLRRFVHSGDPNGTESAFELVESEG